MTTLCSAADWWRDVASEQGLKLLDQHVTVDADWKAAAQTGYEDFERARRLTRLPLGRNRTVLEIGCGAGRMTWVLARHFGQVVATDVSETFLNLARQHCPQSNISFRAGSGRDLEAAGDRLYDVAFAYEVFHYLDPEILQRYVQDVQRLLWPGGVFVVQLNTEPLQLLTRASLLVRYGLHLCGKKYWRDWPTSPHFVRRPYRAEFIVETLRRHGFRVEKLLQPGTRQTWFVAVK